MKSVSHSQSRPARPISQKKIFRFTLKKIGVGYSDHKIDTTDGQRDAIATMAVGGVVGGGVNLEEDLDEDGRP